MSKPQPTSCTALMRAAATLVGAIRDEAELVRYNKRCVQQSSQEVEQMVQDLHAILDTLDDEIPVTPCPIEDVVGDDRTIM